MKSTVYRCVGEIIFWIIAAAILYVPGSLIYRYFYTSAEQLQFILKDECGMDYTIGEVVRNGDNLSRICGLKK